MTQQVRVCRDCGEEYRPDAQRCSDCGGELEDRQLDDEGNQITEAEEETAAPAAAVSRVVFVSSQAAEVVPLAEALREAAIEFHLAEQRPTAEGAPPRYALLVREEDAAEAERALGSLDASEAERAGPGATDAGLGVGHGDAECPACGSARPPGARECPECGLALAAAEEGAPVCARCNAPLPEPGASCPACGTSPIG